MIRTLGLTLTAIVITAACSANVAEASDPPRRQISVTGVGEATGTPDLAVLSFAVRSRASGAGDAFSGNTEQMNRVISALEGEGVEARDLQTDQIALNPVYGQNDRGRQDRSRIVAYEAFQSLTVRLRNIEMAGAVIDTAVKAGANELQSFRLTFADSGALSDQARVAAVEDAVRKAKMMAEAAGAKLGEVLTINSHSQGPQPVAMARMEMADAISVRGARIEAGEQQLRITINAAFALE